MTPKQYQNIGKAFVLIAQLNERAASMSNAKCELHDVLGKVVGRKAAKEFVLDTYGDFFPDIHAARDLRILLQPVIEEGGAK